MAGDRCMESGQRLISTELTSAPSKKDSVIANIQMLGSERGLGFTFERLLRMDSEVRSSLSFVTDLCP